MIRKIIILSIFLLVACAIAFHPGKSSSSVTPVQNEVVKDSVPKSRIERLITVTLSLRQWDSVARAVRMSRIPHDEGLRIEMILYEQILPQIDSLKRK